MIWGQMMEPQIPRPLNSPVLWFPPSLFLKLRLLLADQFTVSKCLSYVFPIGYNFGICHSWQIHWGYFTWPPKAVICCRSVQIPLCRHCDISTQIQDLKHLPGVCQEGRSCSSGSLWVLAPPQHDGDCHHCVVQCHQGPPCPGGTSSLWGRHFQWENPCVCLHLQWPLIAH